MVCSGAWHQLTMVCNFSERTKFLSFWSIVINVAMTLVGRCVLVGASKHQLSLPAWNKRYFVVNLMIITSMNNSYYKEIFWLKQGFENLKTYTFYKSSCLSRKERKVILACLSVTYKNYCIDILQKFYMLWLKGFALIEQN